MERHLLALPDVLFVLPVPALLSAFRSLFLTLLLIPVTNCVSRVPHCPAASDFGLASSHPYSHNGHIYGKLRCPFTWLGLEKKHEPNGKNNTILKL